MPDDRPTEQVNGVPFPVMEFRIEDDGKGGRKVSYEKRFEFMYLRDLAEDLMDRSAEADREKQEDECSDLVAVILLLAASLECFLNDMLIAHARQTYGTDYRQVAEGFLNGSLRSRVLRIVPIVSGCKKRLDVGHHLVAGVFNLIKVRNSVAHAVEHYVENPTWEYEDLPKTAVKALTYDDCVVFLGALDAFFAAVLSGTLVLAGNRAWDHALIRDAEREPTTPKKQKSEHPPAN